MKKCLIKTWVIRMFDECKIEQNKTLSNIYKFYTSDIESDEEEAYVRMILETINKECLIEFCVMLLKTKNEYQKDLIKCMERSSIPMMRFKTELME